MSDRTPPSGRIFLRILAQSPSTECWNPATAESYLTEWVLTRADEPISTYELDSLLDEIRCVAAHQLTRRLNHVSKTTWAVRIFESDLLGLAIAIRDDEKGTTGILDVDIRHRNLDGSAAEYARLGASLAERILEGEDRVRRIDGEQLRVQLGLFGDMPTPGASEDARRLCALALSRGR